MDGRKNQRNLIVMVGFGHLAEHSLLYSNMYVLWPLEILFFPTLLCKGYLTPANKATSSSWRTPTCSFDYSWQLRIQAVAQKLYAFLTSSILTKVSQLHLLNKGVLSHTPKRNTGHFKQHNILIHINKLHSPILTWHLWQVQHKKTDNHDCDVN